MGTELAIREKAPDLDTSAWAHDLNSLAREFPSHTLQLQRYVELDTRVTNSRANLVRFQQTGRSNLLASEERFLDGYQREMEDLQTIATRPLEVPAKKAAIGRQALRQAAVRESVSDYPLIEDVTLADGSRKRTYLVGKRSYQGFGQS